MAYTTKVDLTRQGKIFSGDTANFKGSINLERNFSLGGELKLSGLTTFVGSTYKTLILDETNNTVYKITADNTTSPTPISGGTQPFSTGGAFIELGKKADLVGGKVPTAQLPTYQSDVREYTTLSNLPSVGESNVIYITTDTNLQYRWTGSNYIPISAVPVNSDEIPEGSVNLYYSDLKVETFGDANYVQLNRTISTTAPLSGGGSLSNNLTLSIPQATSSQNGYLTSSNWSTFNNKQDGLTGTGIVKSTAGTITYINGTASQFVKGNGTLDNNVYLTAITSSNIITALGYTPYNSSNPAGYLTTASISGYTTENWVNTNFYNRTTSDSRFYPLVGNPSNFLTSVTWNNIISRPTNLSQFTNDSNFATQSFVTGITVTKANISDVYSKITSDSLYKSINYSPNWSEIISRPTNLSQFTNDLGNYGSWITKIQGDGFYQPLENQRLSTSSNVSFNKLTVSTAPLNNNDVVRLGDLSGFGGGSVTSVTSANGNIIVTNPTTTPVLTLASTITSNITGNAATATNIAWTGITSRPTLLSQFTNDLGNYGSWITASALAGYATEGWVNGNFYNTGISDGRYAYIGGSNASGTWNINVTGNANSATLWAGEEFDTNTNASPTTVMVYDSSTFKWRPTNQNQLNVNSANYWGNRQADLNTVNNVFPHILVRNDDGVVRLANKETFASSIGVGTWKQSQRDFLSGTLIQTSINYAVTDGEPWLLEIEGNSYGEVIPFKITAQGYIYNNTIINSGGIANGRSVGQIYAFEYQGKLSFWFDRISYWNGFNVFVSSSTEGNKINTVTAIIDAIRPSERTKEVAIIVRQALHSDNFNIYSPTLTGSGASGTWGINITGNATTATLSSNSMLWNSYSYSHTDSAVDTYLMAYKGGGVYGLSSSSNVRTFLGLGSNAYESKTNLSQFTNDLGNYGSWITKIQGDGFYQPLENQRLNTNNDVEFKTLSIADTYGRFLFQSLSTGGGYNAMHSQGAGGVGYTGLIIYGREVVFYNPSVGEYIDVTARTFIGSLSGNATTSTNATNSTLWNGMSFVGDEQPVNAYIMSFGADGKWHYGTAPQVKSWLGLNATFHYYNTFTADANTVPENTSNFTYALNAPYNGALQYFGATNYGMQINSNYQNGNRIAFRTRNGDVNSWNPWYNFVIEDGYVNSWDINIDGNAATASNSTLWNTQSYSTTGLGTSPTLVMGYDGTSWRPTVASGIQSFLGLGSFAYRNSINGNEINTGAGNAAFDIGVAEMLRWKNYGSGHVIFDASNGFSPNGVAVNNTNSQETWSASRPTLMGWNGSTTYGVRVDTARVADSATYATDAGNSTLWKGMGADFATYGNNLFQLIGYDSVAGVVKPYSAGGIQSFLGLGASAYQAETLQSVRNRSRSIYSTTNATTSFSEAAFEIRETNLGSTGDYLPPRMAFHWAGVVASQISIESSGRIAIRDNQGTDYENFRARVIEGQRIVAGYDSGVVGSVSVSNSLRVAGNGGIAWDSNSVILENPNSSTVRLHTAASSSVLLDFWSNGTRRGYVAGNSSNDIGFLNNNGDWTLRVDGTSRYVYGTSFMADSWFRSTGNTGWYSETHGGGIYMEDSTWVRVYSGKGLLVQNRVQATDFISEIDGYNVGNFGIGLVGIYSPSRYQGIFSMGTPYRPSQDGTSLANSYGIVWTYEGMGQAKTGLGHQMLITEAGVTQTAIGNGIWTRAGIFAGSTINTDGDLYVNDYIRSKKSGVGLYNEVTAAHFNSNNSYGYRIVSANNSITQLQLDYSTGTNAGYLYGDSTGFGLLNNQGGWSIRVNQGAGYGGWLFGNWNVNGSVTASGGFFDTSDKRLKTELKDTFDTRDVKTKTYLKNGKVETGYYAQDLQEIMPHTVGEKDGYLTLNYTQVLVNKVANIEDDIFILQEENKKLKQILKDNGLE